MTSRAIAVGGFNATVGVEDVLLVARGAPCALDAALADKLDRDAVASKPGQQVRRVALPACARLLIRVSRRLASGCCWIRRSCPRPSASSACPTARAPTWAPTRRGRWCSSSWWSWRPPRGCLAHPSSASSSTPSTPTACRACRPVRQTHPSWLPLRTRCVPAQASPRRGRPWRWPCLQPACSLRG